MTPVSDDNHKHETLFLVLTECQNVRLVRVTILERISLTAEVLVYLIWSHFLHFKSVCYSYSTTNNTHLLSQITYSCKTLYMFRSFRPSLGTQNCVYSNGMLQTAAAICCSR